MKILFTGASSFTGLHFIKELVKQGHTITATFQKPRDAYTGIRKKRVEQVIDLVEPIFDCPFGSDLFLRHLSNKYWDLLCHHAADVNDYKNATFPIVSAVENNTRNLKEMMMMFNDGGCHRILLTGSVFEQGEGAGSDNLKPVSPYGLAKGLTAEIFQYYCEVNQMKLGKFVIPNPFGPYEEKRFTRFLMESWKQGQAPTVEFPAYVRDNIHVTLLAKAYAQFAENLTDQAGYQRTNPSGYAESQGAFTERFATEVRQRLPWECRYKLAEQTVFEEPKVRINTEPLDHQALGWDAKEAWDEIASYYEGCVVV